VAKSQEGRESDAPAPPAWSRIVAEGPLRLHMLEFQVDIGLAPGRAAEPRRKRAKARSIYDERAATPKGLLECFPEETAAMRRMGKAVNRCQVLALPPYRVFCLPYYYYDGLCSMLYVEREGEFLAAWCEREMENALKPHPVLVNGSEADFQTFLRNAMLATHGPH
jgi:hypothetical protein